VIIIAEGIFRHEIKGYGMNKMKGNKMRVGNVQNMMCACHVQAKSSESSGIRMNG